MGGNPEPQIGQQRVVTDSEAIRASLADPPAFEAVFQRHFDTVHRFLRRRLAASAAEDLASQTFVEAFDTRKRYRPERPNALPWLLGIATNLMRHHYRDEERQLRAYERTGLDPVLGSPEPSGDGRVAGALAGLRPEERDALLLFVWADLGYEEIAEALGLPVGTVRSRLSRARQKLRAALAPENEPTEVSNG